CLRERPKPRESTAQKISNRERGGNRFKCPASVRPPISTKVTAPLLRTSRDPMNHKAIAERIASIGASRSNQVENDNATLWSRIDNAFARREPVSSAARSNAVLDGRYTQSNTM